MKYKELLNYCKDKPGCLSTDSQNKIETESRYLSWVESNNKKLSANTKLR